MEQLMLLAILALVFGAAFLLFRLFFAREGEERALQALGVATRPKVVKSVLLKWSRPFYRALLPLARGIKAQGWREKRERNLLAANMLQEIDVDELLAYKIWLGLVALGLVLLFKPRAAWWVFGLAGLLGFLFPDRWVKERAALRGREIVRAMPLIVDMLALSVEAGLDFMAALGKVVARCKPNALTEELKAMLAEMRLGATRADALKSMAKRCQVPELSSFVAILVQADRMGISIGRVLRAQADKLRTERFQRAERLGAVASQKILFPMILCIMPAVFIVILGPLILKLLFGGGLY